MSISHNLCKGCARGTDGVLRKSDTKSRRNEGEISNQHHFEEFYVNNLTTEDAALYSITLYLHSPQLPIFSTPHLLNFSSMAPSAHLLISSTTNKYPQACKSG